MTADEMKAQYRDACQHPLIVRRYTGTSRTKDDYAVNGNARLYGAPELIGEIRQGDQKVIVLAENLAALDFPFPLLTSDKIVIDNRELAVIVPGTRKALDGTLIAYEVTARG